MFRTVSTSTIALVMGAASAFADVTPTEVWETIRDGYAGMGYDVSVGSQDDEGGRLSLADITVRSTGDAEGEFTLEIPGMTLEQAGADVRSRFEGQMVVRMRNTIPPLEDGGEEQEVGFDATIDMPENQIVTSGSADDMEHVVSVPSVTVEGSPIENGEEDGSLRMTMAGVESTQRTRQTAEGTTEYEFDGTTAELTGSIEATGPSAVSETMDDGAAPEGEAPPEGETAGDTAPEDGAENGAENGEAATGEPAMDSFGATFTLADLTFSGRNVLPADGAASFETDPGAALDAGFLVDALIEVGAIEFDFTGENTDTMTGERGASNGGMTAAAGSIDIDMSKDGFGYSGRLEGAEYNLASEQMAFPIAYRTERSDFGISIPVSPRDEAQPFALTMGLQGLTLNDDLWQQFDPEQTLPRDPANLTVDLAGEAVVTDDFLAPLPEGGATPPEDSPFKPISLTINQIAMDAVGAAANVTGKLEFGDIPSEPTGQITGRFVNLNRLIDDLVTMGTVPEEQRMSIGMMLAMFAKPVEGEENTVETQLKFTEGGSIFANGQQVK